MRRLRWLFVASLLVPIIGSGCGGGQESRGVAIEGTVTVSETPLEHGLIVFQPIEGCAGPTATAAIQKGHFATTPEQGPWPGTFLVKIEAVPPAIVAIAAGKSPQHAHGQHDSSHREIAAEFNRTSKTTVTIDEGVNPPMTFDVRWEAPR